MISYLIRFILCSGSLLNDSTLRQMTVIKFLKNGKKEAVTDMSKCDMNRMVYLYKQMNTAQQTERQRNTGISWTENLATKQ